MTPLIKASIPYAMLLGLLALTALTGGGTTTTADDIAPAAAVDSSIVKEEIPVEAREIEKAAVEQGLNDYPEQL